MEDIVNTRILLVTSLIGGLVSVVLSNVPVLNLVNCLVCAGFWLGPLLAVWLYRRQTADVSFGQAVGIGTLAGVWHGLFGFVLSLAGLAGGQAFLQSYARLIPGDVGTDQALASVGAMAITLAGVVVSILFGAVGGAVGGAILKTTPPASSTAT
jgi:hypothetical protein